MKKYGRNNQEATNLPDTRNAVGSRSGGVVIAVLVLVLTVSGVVGAYLGTAAQSAYATRRFVENQKARIVAEAGLEYAELRLREKIFEHALTLPLKEYMQGIVDGIAPPTSPDPDFAYVTPDGDPAFRITVENDVVYDQIITEGAACRGLRGDSQIFVVDVGAYNADSGIGTVLRMRLQAVGVFLIRYALFYQEDLEIWPGPVMTISGPTHGNANLYLGCNNSLTFWERIAAAGNIYNFGKDGRQNSSHVRIVDGDGIPQSMNRGSHRLDSNWHNWVRDSFELWDNQVLSHEHGIQPLRPPVAAESQTNLHDIIKRPMATNAPGYSPATEAEKFANKAALFIHVTSSNTVEARTRQWQSETNWVYTDVSTNFFEAQIEPHKVGGGYVVTNAGSIGLSSTNLWDAREGTFMAPVDIYMDQFMPVLTDSSRPGFSFGTNDHEGLVYITRDAPTNLPGTMPAVRLRNARELDAPVSIVTDLPLYIEGDFNAGAVTNPALVAGDAVTLLSTEWEDERSTWHVNHRHTADTSFNTVIMTGNVPTQGNQYSGGVENVLRFLENWSGNRTFYRGSIICLWQSEMASSPWEYGNPIYEAPRRDWGYDEMYRSVVPPGMTRVFGMEELEWGYANWSVF